MSRDPVPNVQGSADQPAIRGFQLDEGGVGRIARSVNGFRGDVNLPWQLVVLDGVNDLSISLTAFYASNISDSPELSNAYAPTSILGLGWSLPSTRVVVERKSTDSDLDGLYYLEYEGRPHLLIWVGEHEDALRFAVKEQPLWIVDYERETETWTLLNESGTRSIFGGAAEPGALEHGLIWRNWVGASTRTTPAPTRYVVAWNLVETRTVWGNSLKFRYVSDEVNLASSNYTRATYLSRVEDSLGQAIALNYEAKQAFEYVPPHQFRDGSPNPAYQDRYFANALASIDVYANLATGEIVRRVEFEYEFRDFGGKGDERFKKRLLVALRDLSGGRERVPSARFDYNPANGLRPGGLREVIFPGGAKSIYTYKRIDLNGGSTNDAFRKNTRVDNPLRGSAPRVWHGPDYVVILWYNETSARAKIQVFSHGGIWSEWSIPDDIAGNLNLAALRIAIGAESFVLYLAPKSPTSRQRLHLFRRKSYQFGNWDYQTEDVENRGSINDSATNLSIGSDFVVFNVGGTTTLHRFTYDRVTESWRVNSTTAPTGANVVVAAFGYFYIVGYWRKNLLEYQIFYRNRAGVWLSRDISTLSTKAQWRTDYAGSLWAIAGNFAVATYYETGSDRPKLGFLWWNHSFETLGRVTKDGDAPYSVIYGSMVASGSYIYRFDAGSWEQTQFGQDSAAEYAFGEDFALRVSKASPFVSVRTYDPNDTRWVVEHPPVDTSRLFPPTFSERIATVGQEIFRREPTGNWARVGELPTSANPKSFVNRAPSYLVFQDRPEDALKTKTSVLLVRDGAIFGTQEYPGQKILPDERSGLSVHSFAGPMALVTYPAGESLSSPSKLFLHRILNNSLDDKNQTDDVVNKISIDDGYETYVTRYEYEAKEATFDASGRVVQYPAVKQFFEDKDGRNVGGSTETHYYNGLDNVELKNLRDYYSLLAGWERSSIDRTSTGLPIFRQESMLTALEIKWGTQSPVGVRIPLTILRLSRRDQTDALVHLFEVAASAAGEFDREQIPQDVRDQFGQTGFPLADGASVRAVSKDTAWIIESGEMQFGARRGLLGAIEITGEITQRTFFEGDTATGLQRSQSLVYHDWQGREETRKTVWTYAWEVPSYARTIDSRQLTEIVGATTTNLASGHTIASTATVYASDWNESEGRAWAPRATYAWNGASNLAPSFDYDRPGSNQDWIRQQQVLARNSFGLPLTTMTAGGGPSSILYDAKRLRSVAMFQNVDLSAPGDAQGSYLGFEDYEDLQAWKRDNGDPIGGLITSEDAHTGRRSLKLPGGASGPGVEARFKMPTSVSRAALNYWVKTPPGFAAQDKAGWQISPTVGVARFEAFPDTGGRWRRVQLFVETSGAGGEFTCRAINHVEARPVLIDDVSVAPLPGTVEASVFDVQTWLVTASLDSNGATTRTVYDRSLNPIAKLSPGDQVTSVSAQYFSRMGARDHRFDPTHPNAAIEVACGDGGFLESLRDASWTERWSPSPAEGWASEAEALTHTSNGNAMLTLRNAAREADYGLSARFTPGASGVTAKMGIAVGDTTKVIWDPAVREWLLLSDGSVLARSPAADVKRADWLLIASANGLAFYIDGQLALRAWLPNGLRGALQIFTDGNPGVAFARIMVFYRPRLTVTFSDGAGAVRQSQRLDRTGAVVTGQLKDRMANASIMTKAMRYERAMPAYQADFVTGLDWSSGVLRGQLAEYYSGGDRSDDEGYPYSRELFEAAPAARKIASGRPGKILAIRPGNERISTTGLATNTKATQFSELPPARYSAQMTRDPDGNVTTTFRDLARHVLGKSLRSSTPASELRNSVGLNGRGQVDEVFPPNYHSPPPGSNADGYIVNRTVDVLGRLLESRSSDTHLTRCVYDDAGRLRFILPADGVSAGGGGRDRVSYTKYDALGRSVETGVVETVWDRQRLTALANQDWPDAGADWETRFGFDGPAPNGVGRVFELARAREKSAAAWRQERHYDASGNVIRVEQLNTGDSSAFETLYGFNVIGDAVTLTYPKPTGRDPELVVTYRHNPLGLVDAIGTPENPLRWAVLEYGADGQITSETLNPTGAFPLRQIYRYNSAGFPVAIASERFTETLSYWEQAGADGKTYYNGQISGISYTFGQAERRTGLEDYNWAFAYNSRGEVKIAENPKFPQYSLGSLSQPITYDANGNIVRLSRGGRVEDFTYFTGTNKVKNTDGSINESYVYTESGRTKKTKELPDLNYEQVSGLTIAVLDRSGDRISIKYGEGDRRDEVLDSNSLKRKYFFGAEERPLAEERKLGGATEMVRFIAGAGRLMAVVSGSTTGFVIADHEISTRLVLDDQGQVLAGYNYLPFGEVMGDFVGSDPRVVRYLYSGQEWDGETGLYNMNARLYDPRTRRFLTLDPLQQFPSPYIYAANDPILYIDPTGEGVGDFIGAFLVSISLLVAGVVVDVISGGTAAAVGATLIGAGIGGATASFGAFTEDFDRGEYWKNFGISVGVGAASGLITGGFGAAGSGAAKAAQVGAQLGARGAAIAPTLAGAISGVAGGAASGAVAQTIRNAAGGRPLGEGVGESALFQAGFGLVGGGLTGRFTPKFDPAPGATGRSAFFDSFFKNGAPASRKNVTRIIAPLVFNAGGIVFTKTNLPQQWF